MKRQSLKEKLYLVIFEAETPAGKLFDVLLFVAIMASVFFTMLNSGAPVHEKYGSQISFNGTIGTQQIMPFGTPEEVRNEVKRNLNIAGEKGGLFCCPTHLLDPEVPWEKFEAYIEAENNR